MNEPAKKLLTNYLTEGSVSNPDALIRFFSENKVNYLLLSKELPSGAQKRIKVFERHLKRAKYLAFQLLSLSKGGEIVIEKTDLAQVIKEVASFALAGCKTRFHLEAKVVTKNLKCDPYALSQIFLNLFLNSLQAGAENIWISIDSVKVDDQTLLKILVADDGPGIPPHVLRRIFEPFFTTKKEGSGLGMYIVKRLIERLNGDIQVESLEGEGTTFIIYLPYEVMEEEEKTELIEGKARRLSILVVDDEEDLRESLALILEELGHEVLTAGSGDEALSSYLSLMSQGKSIDLVITDFTMPGQLNGLELAKLLKEFNPALKVILSTGYAEVGEDQEQLKIYLFGILRKPYTLNELQSILHRA